MKIFIEFLSFPHNLGAFAAWREKFPTTIFGGSEIENTKLGLFFLWRRFVVASAIFLTQTTTSGRPQDRERLNNPKYRRDLYVSSFNQHCFVFVRRYCCTHVLALSGGGCRCAGQHQSGDRRAHEQHHGRLQHRHRVDALTDNTTGSFNTGSGAYALFNNTTGDFNTASGVQALFSNTTGIENTAIGLNALYSNTTGNNNTASGLQALLSNTTGSSNTASGVEALRNNTTGDNNTASGVDALFSNTTGSRNTASGVDALRNNTTGTENTASGVQALRSNTTGGGNTASGDQCAL